MASGLPEVQGRAITAPGQIKDAGLADRAAASMFNRAAQAATQIGKALEPLAVKAGEEDAIKDWVDLEKQNEGRGPGKVTERSGFLGLQTAGDVAYNNMMETLYLQKTKSAIETEAMNLANRTETFGDVAAFDADFTKFIEGYGAELDPEFANEFFLQAQKTQIDTRSKIANQKQSADIQEARDAMDLDIGAAEDSILADALAGGYEAIGRKDVKDKLKEYQNLLTIKTQNPLYQYSDIAAERDFRAFKVKLNSAALTPDVKDVFVDKGYGAALQFVDDEVAAMGLPPGETASVRNSLRNEVNLMRQNQSALEAEQEAAEKKAAKEREAAADAADKLVTDALRFGLPEEEVNRRLDVASSLVKPERYTTLSNTVKSWFEDEPMEPGNFAYLLLEAKRGNLDNDSIINFPGDQFQLSRLIEETEKFEDASVKNGRDVIKAHFSKADGLMATMQMFDEGQKLKVKEQDAYDDFAAWYSAMTSDSSKPPPRPSEVQEEAKRIVARYGQIDMSTIKSPYLVAAPGGQYNEESVRAGKTALKDAVKQGRITPEAAAEELAKIELVELGVGTN